MYFFEIVSDFALWHNICIQGLNKMQKVFLTVHFCALKDLEDRCHELLPLRISISCPFTIIIV